jgi:UDP-glucose 4-epimerase
MPKVLVTGTAGFIGSHVADQCLRLGFEVVGVDDLSGGYWRNVPAAAAFVVADLAEPDAVAQLWREHGPFDYVYHLAAYAAEGLSHHIRRFNYRNNLLATANLINAAVTGRVRHFVFTSSIAVYGAGQVPLQESTVPVPEDPYAIAKYACELDLHAAHRVFGLPSTIFRPHNVYGERQNLSDPYRNVIGIFLNLCRRGLPLKIFGDGAQTRAFTHVDDVAPLIAQAPLIAAARNQVFNVGADEPVSVLALAQEVARALGVPAVVEHLPARPEVVHAFADHTRARTVFAPPAAVPLAVGLARMAAWLQTLEPAPPQRFAGIEIPDLLPAGWR